MSESINRILVTGGAGFIGSHTVDLLLKKNKEVWVLDNLSSGKSQNLPLSHPKLQFTEGDILDYYLVKDLVEKCDAVIHLAAIVSVPETIKNPIYSFQINVQGQLHLLQAIHESKRPIRLVYVSSAAVYGEAKILPCQDIQALSEPPLSPYALQKINNEEYGKLYTQLFGLNSQALRYFNVYGPRQDPNSPYSGVISRFINAYCADEELTIYGDGLQSRDFIYVGDVAEANYLALYSSSLQTMNIATGHAHTLLELIQYIELTGDKPAKTTFAAARKGDVYHSYANPTLAAQILGFKSRISLKEGIQTLINIEKK